MDNKTVLIVEDNPLNMKLAADVLELNGFAVVKATDGETALQLIKSHPFQLILLDIHLPGMDGFELFQRIHDDPACAHIRIVALTASAMREDEERIRQAGFHDYIAKPIEVKSFIQKVRTLTAQA